MLNYKKVRYAYWLATAFFKKNLQSIILSFVISIIGIIAAVSFYPYLLKAVTTNKKTIGISGVYNSATLPVSIMSQISNGLVYTNEKGEIVPAIADSWESLNNGKEFRFHIKKDLLWNDGRSFTAHDINYVFKDVETKVEGDNLIIFKLKRELPIFPIYLTKPVVKYPLVGVAGLYKVEKAKIKFGQINELELTPQRPGIPILVYKFYDNDTKLLNAYKLGEIDEMVVNKQNIADTFSSWKNTEITKAIDYTQVMTLFFNMNNPYLKEDKDLRKAIAAAIDSSKFAAAGDLATSPLPPTSWAYDPNVKRILYDPDKAEKAFKKEDDSTKSATLNISTYYDYLSLAESIKEDFDKVGLQTQVEVLSGPQPPNYDILLTTLHLSNDPDQYFYWHSSQIKQDQTGSNITNYNNVKVDKLLEDGRATLDPASRKTIYSNFQKTLVDDMPAYFLYYPFTYTIRRK